MAVPGLTKPGLNTREEMRIRTIIPTMRRVILGTTCLCVLVGILFVGLWPFTAHPTNQVKWLKTSNGLHFGDYGQIVSSGTFAQPSSRQERPCSLEMWFEPGLTEDTNTMLAFYTVENPLQFRIRQFNESVFVIRGVKDEDHVRSLSIGVEHVLRQGNRVFLAVTSDGEDTSIYINGDLLLRSSQFGLNSNELRGQLIIGNAPWENDSWSGQFLGLAIYARDLSADEISQHYNLWASGKHPEISAKHDMIGLYTFDEGQGQTIHDLVKAGPDLFIPSSFEIGRQVILEPFWKEYHPAFNYYKDLAINIAGFIPLGFIFCAYFRRIGKIRHPVLVSITIGFATSLTIEILQAYIPTRASGTTDLITNTLGAAIGAKLYGYKLVLSAFDRLGL
jgi:VanZ family protein